MIFYYTGSEYYLGPQTNIDKSIGGFLSGSKVPNNSLSNIFSDVSQLARRREYVECKAIVLKNTTGVTASNLYLYHTYPTDSVSKIEFAAVTLVSEQKMEKIPNFRGLPYVGTFVEPVGSSNKVLLTPSFGVDATIGLWIKRTIIIPDPMDDILPADLEVYQQSLSKREDIVVTLEYT